MHPSQNPPGLQQNEKDALVVHGLFTLICILILAAPIAMATGVRLFALVVLYDLLMVSMGLYRKDRDWLTLWLFAAILSVFQVFPDWFLSAQLDILVFPEDGLFKIGTVSGYMAGLWTIPIFIIVFIGEQVRQRCASRKAIPVVALASLLIFGGSEQTLWMLDSWYAQNVTMAGHVALYILIPEVILGVAAWQGFQVVRNRSVAAKAFIAFVVMQLYLGSAAFFYFVVEKLI